jgi:hypothetical protein
MYEYWKVQYRENGSNIIKTVLYKGWLYSVSSPFTKKIVWCRVRSDKMNNDLTRKLREQNDPRVLYFRKHGYGLSVFNRNYIFMNAWKCNNKGERDES